MPRIFPVDEARPDSGPPPIFERIAIVGFGLIGGSIGLAVKRRWPSALVVAVDRKDVIETAMRMHAADVAGDDLVMGAECDLVVLAAPVRQNIALVEQLPDYLPGAALVTDVGSTKAAMMGAAAALPGRLAFVGGHPLAGAAVGGVEAARPDLFDGRPWMLTPGTGASDAQVGSLERFVEGLGAVPRRMAAADHDRLLAHLSHLPQLVVSALMASVGEAVGEGGLALSGRGLADTTRLASSPPGIWRDILQTNAAEIARALDELIARLQAVRAGLDRDEAIDRLFTAAAAWKRRMPPR
jgi:prephenate dehydrogenase